MPAAGDRSASCRRVLPAGYRGSPVGMASLDDAITLLGACSAPSEAFWRLHELDAVRRVENSFRHPVLEVGSSNGVFTRLTRIPVQVGTDREPRAIGRAIERGQYERVFHLDLHAFDYQIVGLYGTVFANSVLEHVSDLELALPNVRSALMPGGETDRDRAVGTNQRTPRLPTRALRALETASTPASQPVVHGSLGSQTASCWIHCSHMDRLLAGRSLSPVGSCGRLGNGRCGAISRRARAPPNGKPTPAPLSKARNEAVARTPATAARSRLPRGPLCAAVLCAVA